jgi:HEAT repeat protein
MARSAALLLVLVVSARAEEVAASLEWEPEFLGFVWFRHCELAPAPPEGVKPPADIADGRFGVLTLADGVRAAVVHEAGGAMRGLWVDTDLDGDLAEETPAPWKPHGNVFRTTHTVRVPVAGESEPYPAMFLFQHEPQAPDRIGVITRVHRRGFLEIGLRQRPVALVDGNGDLRFDDLEHDRVYLDLDGDGDLRDATGSYEMLRFGEAFDLCREGYAAEMSDPLGARVTLRRLPKAPAPRRWIVPPEPPQILHLGNAPAKPFEAFAATFDESRHLADAARYGTPEAFRLLVQVAGKGATPAIRAAAVLWMGHAEYVEHAGEVGRIARDHPDLEVRRAAVTALHTMGAPARAKVYESILRETKDDKEKDLVEDAARHLAYLGTPQSRAALLAAFRAQSSSQLKLQILQGGGGDPAGPDPDIVDAALETNDDFMRGQALEECWRLRAPKARALATGAIGRKGKVEKELVVASIRVLGREADKAAVRALLPWAERGDNEVWREILAALRHARDAEITRAVAEAMRDPGLRTRLLCADLLAAGMRDPSAVPALLKAAAKEKDGGAATRIVAALAAQGDVPPGELLKIAGRDDFPARGDAVALLARVGAGDPAVLRFFRAALGSKSPEDRILALDVAATSRDASFLPSIVENLGHEAWQVRLAAVDALRGIALREGVLPLIDRLDREESARVRMAIAEALFRLTGQDLLDSAEAWRAWWKDNGATFAVPATPPARKADESRTVARFYGLPVRTERVCFVLDRSESMEGVQGGDGALRTRLDVAAGELAAALKRLPDKARVNVVLFDSEVESWKKSLAPLSDSNRADLKGFIAKQKPKGKTNLYDALEAALLFEGVDTIFLLSDGDPTAGYYRATDAVLQAVRRLNQTRRIAIHAVAIGRDSELMRRLAVESGGTYARR